MPPQELRPFHSQHHGSPDLGYDLINLKSLSLVADEVGDNEKAKGIGTTKKMPILIRHQRQRLAVSIPLGIALSHGVRNTARGQACSFMSRSRPGSQGSAH